MFDQPPQPGKSRALKALIMSIVGLLVGGGLCGVDAHYYPRAEFGGSAFAGWGALILVVSGFLFIGSGSALLVSALEHTFKRE